MSISYARFDAQDGEEEEEEENERIRVRTTKIRITCEPSCVKPSRGMKQPGCEFAHRISVQVSFMGYANAVIRVKLMLFTFSGCLF